MTVKTLKVKAKPVRLRLNARFLLISPSGLSLPVRMLGRIANGRGQYILVKTTK